MNKPQQTTPEPPRATLPLPEGVAALELPRELSAESLEDAREWIEALLRRAERRLERARPKAPTASNAGGGSVEKEVVHNAE